jgi:hypothetical protein
MSVTCKRSRTFLFLLVILTAKLDGQVHRERAISRGEALSWIAPEAAGVATITAAIAPLSYSSSQSVSATVLGTSSGIAIGMASPFLYVAQGASLTVPLTIRVMNSGVPQHGATVNFNFTIGSASLSSNSVTTNATGYATVNLTLSQFAAIVQMNACVAPSKALCAATYITPVPASQQNLQSVAGESQIIPQGQSFQPIIVRVTDSSSPPNPVLGATVTFENIVERPASDSPAGTTDETNQGNPVMPNILSVSKSRAKSDINGLASIIASTGSFNGTLAVDVLVTAGASAMLKYTLEVLPAVASCETSADCSVIQLPLKWVNNWEYLGGAKHTLTFPASGSGGVWMCLGESYGPYTADIMTSLNQALQDAETCRTAGGGGTNIIVPHGSLFSAPAGIKLPQTAGDASADFIVLNSDKPLPIGQTVCSHGIQDNVPESTQPGIRNLGCNATNLSYQLGATVTAVSGSFPLANGTVISASDYEDVASMYTIECTDPNCNAISGSTWDSNNVGPHHFALLNGESRPKAGSTGGSSPVALGTGNVTLLSQLPSHIHLAYDYAHGDWADAVCTANCGTSNPTYAAPIGHTFLPNDYVLSCIYCSLAYSYADQSLRPGAEGHGIYCLYCSQLKLVHNWIEGNSTHGLFVGGKASDLAITNMIGGTDVEDRSNRYTYPWTWMWAEQSGNKPLGESYVNKNGEELKNGVRVLRDGNIYEHVDLSGGQGGGVTAKVAQCSAGQLCSNYFLTTNNITMTNNIIRSTCYGTAFGDGGNSIDGGGVSLGVHNVNFSNNLLYANGQFPVTPGCLASHLTPTNGYVIRPGTGFMSWTGCMAQSDAAGNETATCAPIPGGTQLDFVYGDHIAISLCSDSSFDAGFNGSIGPLAPASTQPTALSITFRNPGVTHSSSATGCTVWKGQGKPEYTTIAHNTAIAVDQESGSPVLVESVEPGGVPMNFQWNATVQNNIFVSNWTNLAQAGGINGYPEEGTRTEANLFDISTLTLNHNVIQGRGLYGVLSCNGANPDLCTYVSGDTFYSSPFYSRLPTGNIILDSSSYLVKSVNASSKTLTLVGAGPIGTAISFFWADYTEYGGVNNGAQPPVTIYFPVKPCAVGNDPTAESSVGFVGTMNLGSGCALGSGTTGTWTGYPTLLADWHGYRLCHPEDEACNLRSSPFAAGQPNQATDRTDQGAALSSLDLAETRILYPCPSCTSGNGPYPDVRSKP